jgi:L-alanine-DL-glutamate epimerase-like enolase superfamily enzyme
MRDLEQMKISRIQIAECPLPLPHTLRLGPVEIQTRDYIAVRIWTDAGVFGEAIGYPRGTPLFETMQSMARKIIGGNATLRRQLTFNLEQANVPGRAALTRGLSLVDIALWDITAKKAGQPLYQLLGGLRKEVEATVVAGYYMDRRSVSDVCDEVGLLAANGFCRVKIMLRGDDPVFDRKYISAVIAKLPGQVAADAHWSWRTLTEAKRLCRDLDGLGLNFLEDPFSAWDSKLTRELQRQLKTPIAAGEDVFGSGAMSDMVNAVDILRVDATTCGGITGAIEAINLAAGAGKTVLPHVFAPLHVHLACAFPNVEGVELIPESSGADPVGKLLLRFPEVRDGHVIVSEEPGVGIALDWPAIEAAASRTADVPAK